ncbi:MAG: hypothetical protein ACK40T_00700 [Akkermansiaceae bacterium]
MQRIHKILAICLLMTALVFGVLKILGGVGMGAKGKEATTPSSRDSMTRHERGEKVSDVSSRTLRQRARKLTAVEAAVFLKSTIIPEINFEKITLKDAVKIVNEEIAKQTPDDQPRPRILLHPHLMDIRKTQELDGEIYERKMPEIDELRLRKVPAMVLLKYVCDKTAMSFWFYKGDYYVDALGCDCGEFNINSTEILSRVKIENIDASKLSSKLDEIIENHDFFGPKSGINIYTTEKAREALLKGEVQLPRINVDMKNVTLMEVTKGIADQTKGALMLNQQGLVFNPFNEEPKNEDPFAPAQEGGSFDVLLNEDTMNPNVVPVKDPFE